MKNILLFSIFLLVALCQAQIGGHTTTSRVQRLFVSQDESKFLTLSGTEMVLWDNTTNKVIWQKKLADLGFGNAIIYDPIVSVDPFIKYMLISNKSSFTSLVNLNSFQVTRWDCDIRGFVKDGRAAYIVYDFSKKNSHKAYLFNLDTGNKELITDKMADLQVLTRGDNVKIIYHNKSVNDYNYDKSKVYNLSTKSLTKWDLALRDSFSILTSGNYFVEYSYGEKTIKTTDATGKQIAFFTIKNPVSGSMESNKTHLFYLSETKPHAYFLEQDSTEPNKNISYMYIYDITNGNVIKKMELHDYSNSAQLLAKKEIEKQNQIEAEKQRIYNSPQSVLNRRLFKVQGYNNFVYNTKTKGMYLVVPDKPLYEGNLVRLDALNDDPKLNMEVYEKLENLENNELYKSSTLKPKSCSHCGGKGYISNSYTRTVADYEYTTGKKLVETTTKTNSCGNCGGCGLIPQ